jgi:1-acyl-sn-glycerol-3-phosphate acyltransferase
MRRPQGAHGLLDQDRPPDQRQRYRSRGDDHMALRQITDELMYEIRELTGQEYRNVYAGKTAETEPTVASEGRNGDDADAPALAVSAAGGE